MLVAVLLTALIAGAAFWYRGRNQEEPEPEEEPTPEIQINGVPLSQAMHDDWRLWLADYWLVWAHAGYAGRDKMAALTTVTGPQHTAAMERYHAIRVRVNDATTPLAYQLGGAGGKWVPGIRGKIAAVRVIAAAPLLPMPEDFPPPTVRPNPEEWMGNPPPRARSLLHQNPQTTAD